MDLMTRPRGVIFDMDGLMLDTERLMVDLWVETTRKQGLVPDRPLILSTIGLDEISTKAVFLNAHGPDFPYDAIRDEVVRRMTEHGEREGIPHRPGLSILLDHLAALKLPLAVATSSDRKAAEWKLKKAGIMERFEVLVCGDELEKGKPAPDIFLLAAKKLRIPPADCVGFEDSPAGLEALRRAGIRAVFIKDMIEPPPELLDRVWKGFDNLAEAVGLFKVSPLQI